MKAEACKHHCESIQYRTLEGAGHSCGAFGSGGSGLEGAISPDYQLFSNYALEARPGCYKTTILLGLAVSVPALCRVQYERAKLVRLVRASHRMQKPHRDEPGVGAHGLIGRWEATIV